MNRIDDIENGMVLGHNREEEQEEYCKCAWCGGAIYVGDRYYDLDGESVCKECIDEAIRRAE